MFIIFPLQKTHQMMNTLLDLTIYDKRQAKSKENKSEKKHIGEWKPPPEKLKGKSKSLNRSDRVNRDSKKSLSKSREKLNTFDNSRYQSLLSLNSELNNVKISNDQDNYINKLDQIIINKSDTDSTELRSKNSSRSDSKSKTENSIPNIIRELPYTGSIELKFEEALEVCSDNLYDEIDEEFGRNLFDSDSDNYILEAYNKPGDELIETYIEIEHKDVIINANSDKQKILKPNTNKEISFTSEDEECVFLEAYNSLGHELRKTYSLVDKNLQTSNEDETVNDTISISSDVQQYFNDLGGKYEGEDTSFQKISCNAYINYSRAIDELKNNQQAANLKKQYHNNGVADDSDDAKSESSDEQSYRLSVSESVIKFTPRTKSDFIIHELLETELVYINNLKKILNDYLNYFRKFPVPSQPKVDIIFGNIEAIQRQTIEFYHALLMCSNDYEAVALTFVDFKSLFKLYPIYMKNKPKADGVLLSNYKSLIEDRQKKLRDRLDLMSYLLNPIQRLGRYILLMENLQKSVRRSERLEPAIQILKQNMTKGNDAIAVESILKLPDSLDLYKKGSYIDRERFHMIKPKRQEVVLFLFEEIVVFTIENSASRGDVHNTFTYSSSIQMNDLSIAIVDGDLQTIQLTDYPKCKKNRDDSTYIFEAKDKKTRDNWGSLIQARLWAQLEKFKNQSKSYKSVSRTSSFSIATDNCNGACSYKTSASASVSRENSEKSKGNKSETPDKNPIFNRRTKSANVKSQSLGKKTTSKQDPNIRQKIRTPKSDARKDRQSRFYTDVNSYKTV